jgi:Chromosome segregation ATPases
VLDFGGNSQLSQLQSELEGVKEEREKLESELRLARDERDRFASQVAELAYDRLQKTLAKLEEGDRWRSNLTDRLEQLEQAGALQEQRSSNLEAEFERLAQLKHELSEKLSQLQSQLSKLEKSEINNIYQLQELTQKQKNNTAYLFVQQSQINNQILKLRRSCNDGGRRVDANQRVY